MTSKVTSPCTQCMSRGQCYVDSWPEDLSFWSGRTKRLLEEAEESPDSTKRAILYSFAARIFERILKDYEQATIAYEFALSQSPEDLLLIRASFRLAWTQKDWSRAARLLGMLAPLLESPARRAEALRRRAWILETQLSAGPEASEAFCKAFEENPSSLWCLSRIRSLLPQRITWDSLDRMFEKVALDSVKEPARTEIQRLVNEVGQASRDLSAAAGPMAEIADLVKDPGLKLSILGELAEVLELAGEPLDKVVSVWARISDLDPGNAKQGLAELALRSPSLPDRIRFLEEGLETMETDDEKTDVGMELAELLESDGRPVEAAHRLKEATQLRPFDLYLILNLHRLARSIKDNDLLIDALELRAREFGQDPIAARCYVEAAKLLGLDRKDTDRAARDYSLALELDPGDSEAAEGLVHLWVRKEKWLDLALVLTRTADRCQDDKRKLDLLEAASRLYIERVGDRAAGTRLLNQALQIDSRNMKVLFRVAEVYSSEGLWNEVVAIYENILTLTEDPAKRRSAALSLAGVLAEQQGDPERAEQVLQQVMSDDPDDMEALHLLAVIRKMDGKIEEAEGILRLFIERAVTGEEKAGLYLEIADLYKTGRDIHPKALEAMEQAAALPEGWPAVERLAKLWEEEGDWVRLADLYRAQMRLRDPKDPLWVSSGRLLVSVLSERLGRPEEAEQVLRTILESWPGHVQMGLRLSEILESGRRHGQAVRVIRKLAEENPVLTEPYQRLFELWQKQGREKAVFRAQEVLFQLGALDSLGPGNRVDGPGRGLRIEHALPAEWGHPTARVLGHLAPALDRIYQPLIQTYGLEHSDKMKKRDNADLFRWIARLARQCGAKKYEVYLKGSDDRSFEVLAASPVVLLLPKGVEQIDEGVRRFEIASLFALERIAAIHLFREYAEDIRTWMNAALRSPGADPEKVQVMQELLPRKARSALREMLDFPAEVSEEDMEMLRNAAIRASARCGLIAAGSLETALKVLWRRDKGEDQAPTHGSEAWTQWIASTLPARDLLSFNVGAAMTSDPSGD